MIFKVKYYTIDNLLNQLFKTFIMQDWQPFLRSNIQSIWISLDTIWLGSTPP
jgi:hypothetical protein